MNTVSFSETTDDLVHRLRDLTVLTSQVGAAVEQSRANLDAEAAGVLERWRTGAMREQIRAIDRIASNYRELLDFLGYEPVSLDCQRDPDSASSLAAREYQALTFSIKRLGSMSIDVQRAFDSLSGVRLNGFMHQQLAFVRNQREGVSSLLEHMELLLEELSFLQRLTGVRG